MMTRLNLINNPYFIFILALVLFFPAFMINLNDQPVIEDEAIRSLVAFEMYKSDDYITPTMGGDPYLRKPPLYNWLIAGSFAMFGNYSEFTIRFPMLMSLLLFALTIFIILKKELGTKMGILNALIYLTLGRIILYESLHGLIDITFSWLTYLFFMLSYILFRKKQFLMLFVLAYLITSVTWLMKGLPALVFLGISLLVLFISQKQFRMLFNWRHFVGIFILIVILGAYYFSYFRLNEITPEQLFTTLFEQTTRRTIVRYGLLETVQHLFVFPIDMLYHFLPWSILTLALFARGMIRKIWTHPFLRYNILILGFNIIVYWTSPEVYPRYILMLVPLYFTVISYAYMQLKDSKHLISKIIEGTFGIVLIVSSIIPYASLVIDTLTVIDHRLLLSIIISLPLLVITIVYWKYRQQRLLWFAVAVLVLRIGFDVFILPTRQYNSQEVNLKTSATDLADKTSGKELYVYWNPDFEPNFYSNRSHLRFHYHFHLAAARNEIVFNRSEKKPGVLVISHPDHIKNDSVIQIGEVLQHLDDTRPLPLFRFR